MLGQRCVSQRQDERPGKVSYYFNPSSSESENHQSSASGVIVPGAPRTSTEIKKPLMSIEERETWRERKQSDGGKPMRINRRIKEILIWSERVLIFLL